MNESRFKPTVTHPFPMDNLTVMTHKLAAMRQLDPKLTRARAVEMILRFTNGGGSVEPSFRRYVELAVCELWDQPAANASTN